MLRFFLHNKLLMQVSSIKSYVSEFYATNENMGFGLY